jgi:NADPH-dependent 2,4-dienoyl-CoA reductase/sulfur reductase-like enzyme
MTDVVIVGAGPAGLAAAVRSAENGCKVTLIDDNPRVGGQIWRGGAAANKNSAAMRWFNSIRSQKNISILNGRVVSADTEARQLTVESLDNAATVSWRVLILATGARELFLPFPGWTLPGVVGVGGLQALAKAGLPLTNKRIVVAGSGPLLLAAADYFRKHGAKVRMIAEQASRWRLARFGVGLFRCPEKLLQALQLRTSLHGIPYRTGSWITRAEGNGSLQRVSLTDGRRTWTEECDYAAVAYGLWPNTELATLLGCRMAANAIAVDKHCRTSAPDILCAGEATGIGGLGLSLVEGEIAGLTAAGNLSAANRLHSRRRAEERFADRLKRAFALRPELKTLSEAATIVCRCEDVSFQRLHRSSSWREAKLHTRCGMGPCQGRVCGPALSVLFGWDFSSVRPPIFPARIGTLLENQNPGKRE